MQSLGADAVGSTKSVPVEQRPDHVRP